MCAGDGIVCDIVGGGGGGMRECEKQKGATSYLCV